MDGGGCSGSYVCVIVSACILCAIWIMTDVHIHDKPPRLQHEHHLPRIVNGRGNSNTRSAALMTTVQTTRVHTKHGHVVVHSVDVAATATHAHTHSPMSNPAAAPASVHAPTTTACRDMTQKYGTRFLRLNWIDEQVHTVSSSSMGRAAL